MKRLFSKFLVFAVALVIMMSSLSIFGCGGNNDKEGNADVKTVKISYTTAGYGDAWIKEAVSKFNETFKSQKIEAVLGRCDPNFGSEKVMNEIKSVKNNEYDLYFSIGSNLVPQLIDASFSALKTFDEVLLEDLTDFYQTSPIKVDGTNEGGKIIDTRNETLMIYTQYLNNQESNYYGKSFSFQWTSAYGGLLYNKQLLNHFGYTSAPRTTREMVEMLDAILLKNEKTTNNKSIKPMTWSGKDSAGYSEYVILTMLAQYMGIEEYNNFFKMIPTIGTTKSNGYDVYNNEGILYSLESLAKLVEKKYAADGTVTTVDHLFSEQTLLDGEAVFAITGDWCYNEMVGVDYTDEELNNIAIMAVPVVSELGSKIGVSEAILREIISQIDEGKTDSAIATSCSCTAEQVAKVREARGVYFENGVTHQAFIPSYSKEKDVAKKFLQYIASKDFAEKIYAKKAYGITANSNASVSTNAYLTSLSNVTKKSYSTPVADASCLSTIRMGTGFTFIFQPQTSYPDMTKGLASGVYTAQNIYENAKNTIKNNWSSIIG